MKSDLELTPAGSLRSLALESLRGAGLDSSAAIAVFVPGRIEFLGKHTDYCGGRSLLCAVERGICMAAVPRADALVRVFHPAMAQAVEFALRPDLISRTGRWDNYLMAVARRVARNFPGPLLGADIAIQGNLPVAAGLSSSSVMVVGMFLILSAINALERRPNYQSCIRNREDLAGYLGSIENGQGFQNHGVVLAGDQGVGTLGGSQDHTAILCSVVDQLKQYSFTPVRCEADVPLPPGHRFVVISCGIAAEKTGAAQSLYNRGPLVVRHLLKSWNDSTGRADPCLAAATRSDPSAADRLRQIIRDERTEEFPKIAILDRLSQFVEESERIVPAAAAALRAGDLRLLGEWVDQSQQFSERWLGNQIPQTVFLANSARRIGAVAASAFGAGFGGSVWALAPDSGIDVFREEWMSRYRQEFPTEGRTASAFITRAGPGAFRWDR